jgi:hypothetical protein
MLGEGQLLLLPAGEGRDDRFSRNVTERNPRGRMPVVLCMRGKGEALAVPDAQSVRKLALSPLI